MKKLILIFWLFSSPLLADPSWELDNCGPFLSQCNGGGVEYGYPYGFDVSPQGDGSYSCKGTCQVERYGPNVRITDTQDNVALTIEKCANCTVTIDPNGDVTVAPESSGFWSEITLKDVVGWTIEIIR